MEAERHTTMDNFSIIYKILRHLERAMDYDEPDTDQISSENLGISQNRWNRIIEMLVQSGYIQGISIKYSMDNSVTMSVSNPRITLKGLEYLSESSIMKKAANTAKGIKEFLR